MFNFLPFRYTNNAALMADSTPGGPASALLLTDGISGLLLTDGTSFLLLTA